MAYSDAELAQLYGDLSPVSFSSVKAEIEEPLEEDRPYHRLKQVANIVPKAIGNIAGGIAGINQLSRPDVDYSEGIEAVKNFPPSFDVGPNTGILDVALNNIAPEIVSWIAPYAGISKVGKAVGLTSRAGQILTEGLAQGGATALTRVVDTDLKTNPLEAGAWSGVSGMLQAGLPRWQRALPLAAVSAAAGLAHDNWWEAGINFIGNMLPGALAKSITQPVIKAPTALHQIFESPHVAGEFNFMDDVAAGGLFDPNFVLRAPETPPLGSIEAQAVNQFPKQPLLLKEGTVIPRPKAEPIVPKSAPADPASILPSSVEPPVVLSKEDKLKGSFKARKGETLQKGKMEAAHKEGKAYARKAENFEIEGNYEVTTSNGKKYQIFHDPESTNWFYEALEHTVARSIKEDKPTVRLASTGEEVKLAKRGVGNHIVSTAVKDNDTGEVFVSQKWNEKHDNIKKQDPTLMMTTKFDSPKTAGEVEHGFMDANGNFHAREPARTIAFEAGQTPKKTGKLHSQDLVDPVVVEKPKSIEQHQAAERLEDAKVLDTAIKEEATLAKLEQRRHVLRDAAALGDEAARDELPSLSRAISGMKKKLRGPEAGLAINPTMVVLGAAGVGGLVTYQQTKGDIGASIAAGLIIVSLGTAGVAAFKHLRAVRGPEGMIPKVHIPDEKISEGLSQFAKDTTRTSAGLAVAGRGGLWAGAVASAEHFFGLNKIKSFVDAKVRGDGFIADLLDQQTIALRAGGSTKATPAFNNASEQYLRGQLADPAQVQTLLNSGGIIGSEGGAWSKLSTVDKAKYPERWLQLDDAKNTNTRGEGVTVWHVTNSVKQKLLQNEYAALMRAATSPEDLKFAEYVVASRKHFDELMSVIHAAAGPKEFTRIAGTMGQYMTRSHALITDPKHYPDEATIQLAMAKLGVAKTGQFLQGAEASLVHLPGTVSRVWGGDIYHMSPAKADAFDNLYTPESLRAAIGQEIKRIKQIGAQQADGLFKHDEAQFQGRLFSGRKELDEVTQALLGTHTAPLEMVRNTMNKLIPAARAAHVMLDLTKTIESSGLPGRFVSEIEHSKALNRAKDALKRATDPRIQREIQNQINELSSYMPIGTDNPSMGLFQGSFVSRHVYGQLDEMMNPFGMFEDAIGTGLRHFNNAFKESHLVLNPIAQARNAIQIPAMLVIGRAAHDFGALKTAYNIIFKGDRTSDVARWAIRNGVTAGNAVHGELNFGLRELVDGTADQALARVVTRHTTETSALKALAKGEIRAAAHLAYAKPDDFVRASTFIAAAKREAKRLGVPLDKMHLDDRVTDAARAFMQRRSMDYANVPKWVKVGRQIPLVTPFLTYSHEIIRITANMAQDALKGDLVSGAGLAALSALPFLAQGMAEESLSPEDRKAWDRSQSAAQDYSRPRFKMPMSRNKDGSFNFYDITPLMPFGDYLMMGYAAADRDLSSVAAVNPIAGVEKSPLLNLIAEQVTGKEIHSQKEFRTSWDRAKNVLQSVTPPWVPGIGKDADKDWPEWMGGKLGQTNLKTGRTSTIKGALMRNILGVDESQVNPDIAVSNMIKSAQHDIANERQYLNDVLRSQGISEEARQRALNRYAETVKHITDTLATRLQPTKL